MPGWPMQFDLVLVVHVAIALSLLELAGRVPARDTHFGVFRM